MVLGTDAIVRVCVKLLRESWEVKAAVRRVEDDNSELDRAVRAVNMCVYNGENTGQRRMLKGVVLDMRSYKSMLVAPNC